MLHCVCKDTYCSVLFDAVEQAHKLLLRLLQRTVLSSVREQSRSLQYRSISP
jgi:hypothetical protein